MHNVLKITVNKNNFKKFYQAFIHRNNHANFYDVLFHVELCFSDLSLDESKISPC